MAPAACSRGASSMLDRDPRIQILQRSTDVAGTRSFLLQLISGIGTPVAGAAALSHGYPGTGIRKARGLGIRELISVGVGRRDAGRQGGQQAGTDQKGSQHSRSSLAKFTTELYSRVPRRRELSPKRHFPKQNSVANLWQGRLDGYNWRLPKRV
jgi:hypothetical protein